MNINYYGKYKIGKSHKGYVLIYINGKEVKLHVFIWEKKNGEKPKGHDIHHKDFDKGNYNLKNLELLTFSDHKRIHNNWIRKDGKWIKKPCNHCKNILPLEDFYFIKTRNIESNFCKRCHNEVISERNKRPENIEKLKKYKHEYYKKNCKKQR